MRNIFVFLGALLLVDDVSGVDVSVMEGDSVTLNPDTEIPEDDTAEWFFGKVRIARMNKAAGLFSTSDGDDGRFRGKLELDKQTGSLTITNTRTNHAGLYKLQIRSKTETPEQIFNVTVSGDAVKSLSVVEGDTVTLHTGVTGIQRDDQIQWKFGDQVLKGPDDTRGRNGIGDLTIRNIRRDQSGDYELEINTISMILHRKFHINITDGITPVSAKEGESITLDTGLVESQGYDLILWKFKDYIIAEINKGSNLPLTHDTGAGGRFKGRLQLDNQSGSLTISGSRTTDSEDYHLNMSRDTYTIQRILIVTVDSGSSGSVGISGASVGVTLWAVTVFLLHEV